MATVILPNGTEWQDELGMNNSQEAMEWVNDNLLNQESVNTTETVERAERGPLTRIKTQTYSNGTHQLLLVRDYPTVETVAGVKATYTLTEL